MATKLGSQKVQELDRGQKIQIRASGGKGSSLIVESPLPDSFGYSSGSQFGSPFASYSSSGLVAQIGAATGFSDKFGLFTEKFYEGPQENQISFEMKFDTWENSEQDVIQPSMFLMILSTGYSTSKISSKIETDFKFLKNAATFTLEGIVGGSKALHNNVSSSIPQLSTGKIDKNIFQMLHQPPQVSVRFGNTYILTELYLSNVSLQFSNTLDHNFLPMSCTASVTADFKYPLTQGDIRNSFGY